MATQVLCLRCIGVLERYNKVVKSFEPVRVGAACKRCGRKQRVKLALYRMVSYNRFNIEDWDWRY